MFNTFNYNSEYNIAVVYRGTQQLHVVLMLMLTHQTLFVTFATFGILCLPAAVDAMIITLLSLWYKEPLRVYLSF